MTAPLILLTGATGYIASHTWLALEAAGMRVVGIDNFANSSALVLERLRQLGADVSRFEQADVRDAGALDRVFERHPIDAVVHFAALKAVGESTAQPLAYYANNVGGLITLLETMQRHACRRIVFSSSATVYGKPERLPIREDSALSTTSPYGATKLIGENLLRDLLKAEPSWSAALLRYFNPVGAHESGLIGEDPRGTPNNLMPYVTQVAVGKRPALQVFGSDYDTPDGTGVRDYLHVQDLAEGHAAALSYLLAGKGSLTVNLGTGNGVSVLELVRAFERASGRPIPYQLVARRPGDVDSCYADPSLAHELLGWRARRDVDAMCADSWRWQSMNPNGYAGEAGR
ncbi:UDP-glucose 4-epimerase GalE [Piscinibacter koreensis]|uniref:UDP-glucose 4-epimerase n=1 Tax=Piscinibacter koreensis TaxID=2742824 RepID=A0A7Y6NMA1_9BURK|nr:UDP-glucose 4-epimerase GalE [Schlegelella koreensis]NUZ05772.1 UDP-glucose 4-epimerase GalE [Schlegelella koreensis]